MAAVRQRVEAMIKRNRIRKLWMAAAALAAGTLPNDCQVTTRDSFVQAAQGALFTIFDPSTIDYDALIRDLFGAES